MFLMLIKDNNNTLQMPNKRAKDLQCYIAHQKFQSSVNLDLNIWTHL